MPNKVIIELSDRDARLFKEFQRHYETFDLLLSRGVFDVRNGSVILDFDKNAQMQTIRFTGYMFSRRHETEQFTQPSSFFHP